MNLEWGDKRTRGFVTNVGLITSNGPYGNNVMACEWTHYISYSPGLITLAIGNHKATYKNIISSKEFGISIASEKQTNVSQIVGNNSGYEVDKIKVAEELGIKFYKAQKINTLMVEEACMNVECKLIKTVDVGDHPLLIGEVVEIKANEESPLLYYNTQYFKLGEHIEKPSQEYRDKIKLFVEKYKKE